MTKRRAFTLIELLVVIAIIGILAAILYPTLSASSARSREFECQSNLQQVSVAMQAYVEDYDAFPRDLSTLGKIMRNKQILVCPATGLRYYYRAPKGDVSPGRIVASCSRKGYPHRFNECRYVLTAGGAVRKARGR